MNSGCWYLPHPQLASWVDAFLFELSAFPRGKHDDWLDAWTQAREALSGAGLTDYSMYTAKVNVFAGLPPGYYRHWPW